MRVVLAVMVVLVMAGTVRAGDEEATLHRVVDAVTQRDAPALTRLAPTGFQLSGLWFDTAVCAKQFSGTRLVSPAGYPAFLECLAALGIRLELLRPEVRILVLAYDPGVSLRVSVRDGVLQRITGSGESTEDPTAAPITSDALASHRISGTYIAEPDRAVRDSVARSPDKVVYVTFVACVDATGKLERIRIVDRSTSPDSYVQAVEDATAQWKFRPFQVHGKAVRVCSFEMFAYPPQPLQRRLQSPRGEAAHPR